MPELLITNTEAISDREAKTTDVHLFGRTTENDREHTVVRNVDPYFYVPTSLVLDRETEYLGSDGIVGFDHDVDVVGFGDRRRLSKVTVQTPRDVRGAADLFPVHYGADVDLTNRFRVDTDLRAWVRVPDREAISADEIEPIDAPVDVDPTPRTITFDIETDDRGSFPDPGEKRITSVVAHDNYDDEYIGFIDGDGRQIETMFPEGKPEEVDALHIDPNERQMLIRVAAWIATRNPDLLTAWNVDFDAPYLIERMNAIGANPARLSTLGEADVHHYDGARIRGHSVYDLLTAYKKNSWGELRSYGLDYVANQELGASKIDHDQGYFEMYEDDPALLVNYNARDVRLAVGINDTAGVIEFRDNLRKQIGVDFEDTVNNYQFVEMMCRRKLKERGEVGPTADPESGEKYDGGYVVDPYTGVARNVVGIDVESLYPWTMFMLNASPDTKIDEERAIAKNIPYSKAPNGVCFRLDRNGLFRELVEDALALKEGFRTLKNEAPAGSVEEAIYDVKYQVSKTITNSIYGTIGWDRFFLYDRETAEAVTLAGQAVLKGTAEFVDRETAADVVYGDTDSNYISFPDDWSQATCVESAMEICDRLETEVYPSLAADMGMDPEESEWRIGPEMFAARFLQWGKKKKYAYRATWKEGMADPAATMDDPEIVIKGSAAKRSDSSRLTRDTEKAIINAILADEIDAVTGLIYEAARKIDPDDPAWAEIGIPGGIRKELAEYDPPTAHVRAAMYANDLCGTEFGKASKPQRCYIRPTFFDKLGDKIDVIAYETEEDLRPIQDKLIVDAGKMTDTLLINPMREMLESVGVDVHASVTGQSQTGLESFL